MNKLVVILFILAFALSAQAQPTIYVLPVQGEVPFLTQMPGTNIFVGPGAASIFSGKVTINGKEFKKFPEPPANPPEWANGLKERIERAVQANSALRLTGKKSDAKFILRVIVTHFGETESDETGVTYDGLILSGKTEEPIGPVRGSATEPANDAEPDSLTWPDFTNSENQSGLGTAAKNAAHNLVEDVKLRVALTTR
jgi:hypothetical protein